MSRQQAWATHAFDAVTRMKGKDLQSKYRTHALKFPALLIQSGLAQSLAFVNSRDEAGKTFVGDLAQALGLDREGLLERSRQAKLDEYARLAALALGAGAWFRRFASELKAADGEA